LVVSIVVNGWRAAECIDASELDSDLVEGAVKEREAVYTELEKRPAGETQRFRIQMLDKLHDLIVTPTHLLREFATLYHDAKGDVYKPKYDGWDGFRRLWVMLHVNALRRMLDLPLITEIPVCIKPKDTSLDDRIWQNGLENFSKLVGVQDTGMLGAFRFAVALHRNRKPEWANVSIETLLKRVSEKTFNRLKQQKFNEIILADAALPDMHILDKALSSAEYLAKLDPTSLRDIRLAKDMDDDQRNAAYRAYLTDPAAKAKNKSKAMSGKDMETLASHLKTYTYKEAVEACTKNDASKVRSLDIFWEQHNICTLAIRSGQTDHPVYGPILKAIADGVAAQKKAVEVA